MVPLEDFARLQIKNIQWIKIYSLRGERIIPNYYFHYINAAAVNN